MPLPPAFVDKSAWRNPPAPIQRHISALLQHAAKWILMKPYAFGGRQHALSQDQLCATLKWRTRLHGEFGQGEVERERTLQAQRHLLSCRSQAQARCCCS